MIKKFNHKIIFIILNFLVLILNLIYLFNFKRFKRIYFETKYKFRFSENFDVIFMNKTNLEIASNLNNKFEKSYQNFTLQNNKNKKTIKICFLEFYKGYNPNSLIKYFDKEKFIFKFDINNPDYLIYNTFFSKNPYDKKYKNAIKIALSTENKIPDFNEADYAIGFIHLNYLDRYFKYFQNISLKLIINIINSRKYTLKAKKRKLFCAAVISNNKSGDLFRLKFIEELNKYKKIDMGGNFKNNVGGCVKNKIKFLKSYKFSIAMENSDSDGYFSEKIFDSYLSGTIPIYYGDYMLDEYFNPKSYILIRGEKDMQHKIDYIKRIDNDENLYKSFLKEKVINTINILKIYNEQKSFWNHIFEQNKLKAYRIDK